MLTPLITTAGIELQTKTGSVLVQTHILQQKHSKCFWAGWKQGQEMGLGVRDKRKASGF